MKLVNIFERKELYSLYSSHDNRQIIQDSCRILIIAIYGYLFTYLQLLRKTKGRNSDYPKINEIW